MIGRASPIQTRQSGRAYRVVLRRTKGRQQECQHADSDLQAPSPGISEESDSACQGSEDSFRKVQAAAQQREREAIGLETAPLEVVFEQSPRTELLLTSRCHCIPHGSQIRCAVALETDKAIATPRTPSPSARLCRGI